MIGRDVADIAAQIEGADNTDAHTLRDWQATVLLNRIKQLDYFRRRVIDVACVADSEDAIHDLVDTAYRIAGV